MGGFFETALVEPLPGDQQLLFENVLHLAYAWHVVAHHVIAGREGKAEHSMATAEFLGSADGPLSAQLLDRRFIIEGGLGRILGILKPHRVRHAVEPGPCTVVVVRQYAFGRLEEAGQSFVVGWIRHHALRQIE